MINKQFYKKNFLYISMILIVFLCQSLNFFQISGYKFNLLPAFLIAIAIIDTMPYCVFYSFFIGFLCDLNFSYVQGLNSVFFVICSLVISFLTIKIFNKSFVTNMMFISIILVLQKLLIYLYYFFVDQTPFFIYFQIVSAEVLITTLLSPIAYFLVCITNFKRKTGE